MDREFWNTVEGGEDLPVGEDLPFGEQFQAGGELPPAEQTENMEDTGAGSIEEAFAQLQTILNNMNREDIPLEEAFAQYEKGMRLIRYCNDSIDRVEKKVRILSGEENRDEF